MIYAITMYFIIGSKKMIKNIQKVYITLFIINDTLTQTFDVSLP